MRAFLSGVGGFVGAHLAARLVADGWDVLGTVRPGGSVARLAALGVDGAVEVREVELSEREATQVAAAGADADAAFLLAAARSWRTEAERAASSAVNAASAGWVVEALPERCRTVVRLGSSTEYAESPSPMDERSPVRPRGSFGASKAAGSRLVSRLAAERGLRAAILRAFQVYGPLDHPGRLVPAAFSAARTGSVLPLTGPGRRRDWVHVDDVVDACVRAATESGLRSGQVLNIGTGRQSTNEDVVAEVARAAGRPVRVAPGAHPGREWDTASWVCDPTLAGRLLGWTPALDLAGGLARSWEAEQSLGWPVGGPATTG